MFDTRSRYAGLSTSTYTFSDGRVAVYVARRFLPRASSIPTLVKVDAADWERLDHIASRTVGDAELSWRIADANEAMNPVDLLGELDGQVRVGVPGFTR